VTVQCLQCSDCSDANVFYACTQCSDNSDASVFYACTQCSDASVFYACTQCSDNSDASVFYVCVQCSDYSDVSLFYACTQCSDYSDLSRVLCVGAMQCRKPCFMCVRNTVDSSLSDISTVVANRKREESRFEVASQGHVRFSVWVSFAEIYQDQIYDLLVPVSRKKLCRRVMLQLREDREGQPYIKGWILFV